MYINDHPIERVEYFCYLGSHILPNGQAILEVEHQNAKARAAFGRLNRVLWPRTDIRRCEYTTQWSDLSPYMTVKPGQSAYLMFQLYKSVRIGVSVAYFKSAGRK